MVRNRQKIRHLPTFLPPPPAFSQAQLHIPSTPLPIILLSGTEGWVVGVGSFQQAAASFRAHPPACSLLRAVVLTSVLMQFLHGLQGSRYSTIKRLKIKKAGNMILLSNKTIYLHNLNQIYDHLWWYMTRLEVF